MFSCAQRSWKYSGEFCFGRIRLLRQAGVERDVALRRRHIEKIAADEAVGRAVILVGADEKRVPADGLFRRVEHRLDALALVLIVAPACDLVHILAAVIAALEQVAEIGDVIDGAARGAHDVVCRVRDDDQTVRERLFGDLKKRLVAAPFERGLLDGKLKGVKLCKESNEPVDDLVEVGVFVKQDAVQRMMALQLGRLGLENEAVVFKKLLFQLWEHFRCADIQRVRLQNIRGRGQNLYAGEGEIAVGLYQLCAVFRQGFQDQLQRQFHSESTTLPFFCPRDGG